MGQGWMNCVGRGYGFSVTRYQLLSETAGGGDGDLLAKNCAYG
jgi:hypothetical protein